MDCIRSIEYVYFILDGILLIPGSFSVLGWPPWVYSLGIEEKKKPGTYIYKLSRSEASLPETIHINAAWYPYG